MPPYNEHTISTPLPEGELRQVIHDAYGDDESTAMLTQVTILIKRRVGYCSWVGYCYGWEVKKVD